MVWGKNEKGQATVEMALVLPILLLLLCGIIDFGWIFGSQQQANNACREAARYIAIHYHDSDIDDDEEVAAEIVSERAPTLSSAVTTISVSSLDEITVSVSCQVNILTPFLSIFFPDGKYTVKAKCVMRLE